MKSGSDCSRSDLIKVPCNYCGSDEYIVKYPATIKHSSATVSEFTSTSTGYAMYNDIVRCLNCGLIYMNPRDRDIVGLYEDVVDEAYLGSWPERAEGFAEHIKTIEKYKPGRDMLDIGCYAGIFPDVAVKAGYNVTAIEPSKWASEHAKKTGARIIQGGCGSVKLESNTFDVVTMWDVVEHLEDPMGCLERIHDYLRPGGIAIVATHDIGAIIPRILGKRYPWLMRFHLYHFTPRTLGMMMKKAGLELVETKYYGKTFTIKYLLSRLGIETKAKIFENYKININPGDLFLIVGRKKQGSNLF